MNGYDVQMWIRANEIAKDCGLTVILRGDMIHIHKGKSSHGGVSNVEALYNYMCGYQSALMDNCLFHQEDDED